MTKSRTKTRKKADRDIIELYNYLFVSAARKLMDPVAFDALCDGIEAHPGLQKHPRYNNIVKSARGRKKKLASKLA